MIIEQRYFLTLWNVRYCRSGVSVFATRRQCGPLVRALGLHVAAPGSNPVLTSGLDLFPVLPDSTPPHFVNSQLVASHQLGFLIMFPQRARDNRKLKNATHTVAKE